MTIEADYTRLLTEGNEHKVREELRLDVLKTRIDSVTEVIRSLDTKEDNNVCSTIISQLEKLHRQVDLQHIIQGEEESKQKLLLAYESLKDETRKVSLYLESLNLPKHHAIEIQTSDTGPGVTSKEKLTQIRLAEAFQIHSLYLQARLHYICSLMRSLNEHTGAGHTIPIPSVPITSLVSTGELLTIKQDELNDLVTRKEKHEA